MHSKDKRQMGSKKLGFFLVFFNYLYLYASSSPLQRSLLSGTSKELNVRDIGRYEGSVNDIEHGYEWNRRRSGIAHKMKLARGGGGQGSRDGGSTETPENGNGNQNVPGGGAAIPVIIAGAANNNHHHNNHRGAASSIKSCINFPTLLLITVTSLILHSTINLYY